MSSLGWWGASRSTAAAAAAKDVLDLGVKVIGCLPEQHWGGTHPHSRLWDPNLLKLLGPIVEIHLFVVIKNLRSHLSDHRHYQSFIASPNSHCEHT